MVGVRVVVAAVVAVLGLAGAGAGCASAPAVPESGETGASLPAARLDGAAFDLAQELRAQRSSLLVFATPWCAVCKGDEPRVAAWARSNVARTRTYLVMSGAGAAEARRTIEAWGVDTAAIEVVVDETGAVADRFAVQSTPTLVALEVGERKGTWHRIAELPGFLVPAGAGLAPSASSRARVVDEGTELGTTWAVEVVAATEGERERVASDLAAAHALCRELETHLSEWRADSEVSRVNREAGAGPVTVSPLLGRLLRGALYVSEVTGGAFDVTWPPLGALWDEAARADVAPTEAQVAAALSAVGYRKVALGADGTVRFLAPGVRLGLGGVAKGAIIDAVFEELVRRGHRDVVVNLGGDLRVGGRDERGAIRVLSISDPWEPRRVAATFEAADVAVATSGNYLRRRVVGGERVGHILDPRTGRAPAFDGSVTVITAEAAMADAMATALFVMGPDEGLAFAAKVPGLDAIYVTRDGVRATMPVGG
ncbi:MAG: FAD:protein FMN transferase [Myxococcales bacterium]|nr:FAD:protein FMN transferase [Myxococcales bacterium]